jgi:hypothetical protein
VGILAAMGAVVAVAYIRYPDLLGSITMGAASLGVGIGVALTVRLRAADREPMITLRDLRPR